MFLDVKRRVHLTINSHRLTVDSNILGVIILIEVFMKRTILSVETILRAYTHVKGIFVKLADVYRFVTPMSVES